MTAIPKPIARLDALSARLTSISWRSVRLVHGLKDGIDAGVVSQEEVNPIITIGRAAREGVQMCERIRNSWIDAGFFKFIINLSLGRSCRKTEVLASFMGSFLDGCELGEVSGRQAAESHSLADYCNSLAEKNNAPNQ